MVRRVEIDEVSGLGTGASLAEVLGSEVGAGEASCGLAQAFGIEDRGAHVASVGDVEVALAVDPIKAVVAGLVEEEEAGGLPVGAAEAALVSDVVVVEAALRRF